MHAPLTSPTPSIEPSRFGIGGRITLSVMSDDFQEIILAAIAETAHDGLTIETDPVSTWVTGPEDAIARYFSALIAVASGGGRHVVATIMLSRGCPGEIDCELPGHPPVFAAGPLRLPPTGVDALAQWSLYPLDDHGTSERKADHMRDIMSAIEDARASGTYAGSDHYATRLSGDVAAVIATITTAWSKVGRTVAHVTTHATVSVNSPSLLAETEEAR